MPLIVKDFSSILEDSFSLKDVNNGLKSTSLFISHGLRPSDLALEDRIR